MTQGHQPLCFDTSLGLRKHKNGRCAPTPFAEWTCLHSNYSVVLVPGCTCLTTFLAKAMHLRLHVDVLLWLRSLLAVLLVAMSLLLFVLVLLLLLVLLCAIPAVAAAVCECGCGCSRACSCTCSCTTTSSSSFLLFKFVAVVAVVVVAAAVLVVGHSGWCRACCCCS